MILFHQENTSCGAQRNGFSNLRACKRWPDLPITRTLFLGAVIFFCSWLPPRFFRQQTRLYSGQDLLQRLHPVDNGLSNLIRRVLLKEVKPAHGYLCLRRPAPAELSQSPSQGGSRLAVHRNSVLDARLMSSHGGRLYRRRKERHPQMDILPLARFVHLRYNLTVGLGTLLR